MLIPSLLKFVEYSDGVIIELNANEEKALLQFGNEKRVYEYKNKEWKLVEEE